jgi:hypothetical protein
MKKPVLIFLHIPKTAGSSLGHAMHRQYGRSSIFFIDGNHPMQSVDKFISLPADIKSQYLCISGHIPFGLHEYIPQQVVYTTVLRNPVERLISLYHHVLRETTHYMHNAVVSKKMSLLDFAGSRLNGEIYNDQTRRLSGIGKWDQTTDRTVVDESALRKAIENIEEFFPVVGLTEMFDESLLLMKDAFSWNYVFYSKRKVAISRPKPDNIDLRVIEVIKNENQYDILLYEYAKQRLHKQIAEKGYGFNYRVRWFGKANGIYNFMRSNKNLPSVSVLWNVAKRIVPIRMTHDE